jgi:hypothetical protein
MDLLLTKKQILSLLEQDATADPTAQAPTAGTSDKQAGGQGYPEVGKWESGIERGPANQVGVTKWADVVGSKLKRGHANPLKEQSSYEKGIWDKSTKTLDNLNKNYTPVIDFYKEHNHDINMVLGLGLGIFGGPIGLVIASGLGFLDAAEYFYEGDNKTGGMMLMFAALPGIGGAVSKYIPGAKQLGTKLMTELGKKLSLGQKITNPAEIEIVKGIAKYRPLIEQEMKKVSKELSIKAAKNNLKKQIIKKNITKGATNLGKNVVGSLGLAVGYNYGYDYVLKKQEEENIKLLEKMLGLTN